MKELQIKYAEHGFEIVGVANDDPETLAKYFKDKGELPWANVVDSDGAISIRLGVDAFPTYMLVDQKGRHFATPHDKAEIDELVAEKLGLKKEAEGDAAEKDTASDSKDPGKDFVPFPGFGRPTEDQKILDALTARRDELVAETPKAWKEFDAAKAPSQVATAPPIGEAGMKRSVEDIVKATVILVGGIKEEDSWTAGGVIVRADGLMVTNFHVAQDVGQPIVAMTSEGKVHRVTKVLAGDEHGDVALLQMEGKDFPFVRLAPRAPRTGDDVVLVHHSEDRFYTYDRGYVRRHSLVGDATYMEISGEYAVGGSGCGIFNKHHQLVGLVSTIAYGTGPELAKQTFDFEDEETSEEEEEFGDYVILVRQASSWVSLRSLWK